MLSQCMWQSLRGHSFSNCMGHLQSESEAEPSGPPEKEEVRVYMKYLSGNGGKTKIEPATKRSPSPHSL